MQNPILHMAVTKVFGNLHPIVEASAEFPNKLKETMCLHTGTPIVNQGAQKKFSPPAPPSQKPPVSITFQPPVVQSQNSDTSRDRSGRKVTQLFFFFLARRAARVRRPVVDGRLIDWTMSSVSI